ncbi:MAG: T9SS type B sorting domain-containing protein, partial [Bacteroidia bacterium]|nr:T9SS type B sorting domain-containing protein [Bacteroidia bacterium]
MKKYLVILSLIASYFGFSQDVIIQNGTVNACTGTFLDTGGAGGNYSNNESFVFTICPDTAGQLVELTFTDWNTQLNADIMTIYNGPDTASPAFGAFSGAASPGYVSATTANPSGCLTIEWTSDAAATTTGWAADISCFEPCQTIVSVLDSATPTPNGDGYIRVCPDQLITLEGSGNFSVDGTGATYEWDLGDGNFINGQTAVFSYPNPGVYIVNLNITDTNPQGCTNTNLINQVVQVATRPNFTGTGAQDDTLCFNNNTTIIAGVATPLEFINDCTPPVSGTTFLPDGSGASYTTCITVDCYESSQTLDDINQLIEICLNMEHSYLGDLDIFITSPNGQQVTLKSFGAGGGGTYLGGANDDGTTTPGVGADYCFSMSGSVTLVNGPTVIAGSNPPGNSIAPGTYLPEESFASLLGSPLNGDWCIEVIDNLAIDNGYIFEWGMAFDPALQPPELSFTPVILTESWDADTTIINVNGNEITVQPTTAGIHCYTYRVTDDFGCEYTEEVCIELYPEVINDPPNNLVICDGSPPPYEFDLTQNDAVILASNPSPGDFVVTYYESQADADSESNPIGTPANYTGNDGQTIYVRIEYLTTDCYETSSFTLNVSGIPTIDPVADLEACDDVVNDGFAEFDLTVQDLGILGAQLPADFNVSYYISFVDADAGTNALVSPYTNIVNPQPIFVRVESWSNSSCYVASAAPVFNLIVNPQAEANQPPDMVICDDASNDGVEQFDLDSQTATVLGAQLPALYTVTYHESQADADAGINALVSPYFNISNPQTIYVRVEELANPTCYGSTTFELIVNPLPDVIAVTPFELCDDDTDGIVPFTLTDKNSEVLNGQSDVSVSYHETLAEANGDINALASPYVNTSNPQTIFIRLENNTTGCYNITTMDLIVNPIPLVNTPTPLEACDDDNDGFTQFDLTSKDLEVTGGAPDILVSWHETLSDAQTNVNALASPYNNIVPNTQTVYGRVYNNLTGCFDTVELILIVNALPDIISVTDYELCDDNNPGDATESFIFSSKIAEIENGQMSMTVSFYESLADAQAQINALPQGGYLNTSNPQTIWYVIENSTTLCSDVGSFDLIVNPLPLLIPPTPLEVCDDAVIDGFTSIDLNLKNDEISGGDPNYAVTYYLTQADADAAVNQLPIPYTNISNPQTIYARGQDINTGCYSTVPLDLVVEAAPLANVPTPLEYCDADADGFGEFSLSDADMEITGGAAGVTVSYHETQADAENDVNALSSPYNNIVVNTQTVYARVESATIATDCYTIVELVLIVNPDPQIEDADALVDCDDNADGFIQFDLTQVEPQVLNGLDPLLFTITYYETQANADAATLAIGVPASYTNITNPQTLWIRVEDNATGCYSLTSLDLLVNPLPVLVQPTPLELCDDAVADEITVFDLTVKDGEITSNNGSWMVTYYETNADAQGDTNAIDPATAYTNTAIGVNPANPQTLYVRVTDSNTGCYDFTTLTLRVLPNPTPSLDPSDIELCDDNNAGDMTELFDLTVNELYIINGEMGVSATYHESLEDAEDGLNAIADPTMYSNSSTPQTIWVRVTNDTTGCYTLVDFDIIVNPLPEVIAVTDFIICEDNTDGFWPFDLESKTDEVLNGQDPGIFAVTYHQSQADADAGINALLSPYTNLTNPEQIFVNITNTNTGCDIATVSFNIEVQEAAEANSDGVAILYALCDDNMETDGDPTNDSVQFDLSTQDAALLDGQDPADYTVSYYLTQADAELGVNPLPTLYENVTNPQLIYARVDNDTTVDSLCYAVSSLTLEVYPMPVFDLEDEYILCIDTNGSELIDPPLLDTGLSELDYSFVWRLDGTDIAGATGSSLIPTQGGSYTVVVTDNITGCQGTDTATVTESAPPIVVAEVTTLAFAGDHVIEATASGPGVYEYSLDEGPWQESGTFTGVTPGEHVVRARDLNGCGIGSTTVLVIDYPLYFTPNGDGYNDTWNIVGVGALESAKIYIFDRFGKLLKQLNPSGQGWNGTYNGEALPSSDYWFTIEYIEPSATAKKQFRAHFA